MEEYRSDLSISIHFMTNKTGVAAARNIGLEAATGDYIYFMDSDDYLCDNTLEEMITGAQDRDDDIVYGRKKPTWYQRSVFLTSLQEEQENDMEEESSSDEDEAKENGSEETSENESEDDSEGDSKNSEENDENDEDERDESDSDDPDAMGDMALSEEELEHVRQARKKIANRILVSKRKGVKNISVLSILFKRSFIEENQLRFL